MLTKFLSIVGIMYPFSHIISETCHMTPPDFVQVFRQSSPYFNAHRDSTVVIYLDGTPLQHGDAALPLIQDLALLQSLDVRIVLVAGARPFIDAELHAQGLEWHYHNGLRITRKEHLSGVAQAVGQMRVELESWFSSAKAKQSYAVRPLFISSGNWVMAKPLGIIDGIDFQHTGAVRRIEIEPIKGVLDMGHIALLTSQAYSMTGDIFNLSSMDVAIEAAIALEADKLIWLVDPEHLTAARLAFPTELSANDMPDLLSRSNLPEGTQKLLCDSYRAAQEVDRVHLLDRTRDGALLLELFTLDGVGIMINQNDYDVVRQASIDDIGGILSLLEPLEAGGSLVKRPREQLEMEIDYFTLLERDGTIIGCAALYPYTDSAAAELAAFAIDAQYRRGGRGSKLLAEIEKRARATGIKKLFLLTTQTMHWFIRHGFAQADISALPSQRAQMYNFQRRSAVFTKELA
jgi:amino-acid N-acetyltransferase